MIIVSVSTESNDLLFEKKKRTHFIQVIDEELLSRKKAQSVVVWKMALEVIVKKDLAHSDDNTSVIGSYRGSSSSSSNRSTGILSLPITTAVIHQFSHHKRPPQPSVTLDHHWPCAFTLMIINRPASGKSADLASDRDRGAISSVRVVCSPIKNNLSHFYTYIFCVLMQFV